MFIATTRFERVTYKKSDVIWMMRDLPGFEDLKRFLLVSPGESEPFKWLQSLDDPAMALPVIEATVVKDDYEFEVSAKDLQLLGARHLNDIVAYASVTIPRGRPERVSADLKAPIALNTNNMHALQLLLSESGHDPTFPFYKQLQNKLIQTESQ
jgi:flagellar assembly factor FliW